MEKISYEEALEAVQKGVTVICEWGDHDGQTSKLTSTREVEQRYRLSKMGVQYANFYLKPQDELTTNDILISFDEAYEMLVAGECIYLQIEGEEIKIEDTEDLFDYYRQEGKSLTIYWHE